MNPLSLAILGAIAAIGILIAIIVVKITVERVTGWMREKLRQRDIDPIEVSRQLDDAFRTGNFGRISGVIVPFTYMDPNNIESTDYEVTMGLYDPDKEEVIDVQQIKSSDIDSQILVEHREKPVVLYT
ncbi:MAG: hypothetical protein R3A44_27260 [Caldilineaceae bacterium]